MKNNNSKYVLVQTKVSPATDKRLERVCQEYKFASKYELLQHLISVFLKYADPESEIDPGQTDNAIELSKLIEELQNCSRRINTAAPNSSRTLILTEAIQIYQRAGRNGAVSVKYTFGKDGSFSKTESNSKILRTVLWRLFPELSRNLATIAHNLGVEMDDAIAFLLKQTNNALTQGLIEEEIAKEFAGLSTAENHVDMTGNKPKRTRGNDINKLE